jgi:hypothetical protein
MARVLLAVGDGIVLLATSTHRCGLNRLKRQAYRFKHGK